MLHYPLIHPEILGALAGAGHGSTVLVADANYAHRTGTNPAAPIVHLNLRRGLVTVVDVLGVLVDAAPFESGWVMAPDDGSASPVLDGYAALLGPEVRLTSLPRNAFRAVCCSPDLALTIATGDDRFFANVLLAVGAVPTAGGAGTGHRAYRRGFSP